MGGSTEVSQGSRRYLEWCLLGLVLLLLAAFLGYTYAAESERGIAAEQGRLRVQVDIVADDMERSLTATNQALEGVIRDHLAAGARVGEPKDVSRRLRALVEAMEGVRGMGVYDRNGTMVASNRDDLLGRDFSGRDYFKTVRDKPDAGTLYLSAPFKSVNADLVSTVGRMVPGVDGAFDGVIVATLDPRYFTGVLRPIVYAPDVWSFVVHGDGVQLLNYPSIPGIDGTDLNRPGTFFRRHRDSGQRASLLSGTVYTTGQQRMMALRSVQPARLYMDKALVVGVSRELGAIMQPLERQRATFFLFFAVFASLSCASLYWVQTRRQRVEALTHESNRVRLDAAERVRLALRGANLGLWEIRLPGGQWLCDEAMCAMVGSTMQDLDGSPERWRSRMHPQDREASARMFRACVDGTVPFYDFSYRIQHSDGHWVWVLARAQVVERDALGNALRVMGTTMDISAAKEAEAQVVQARNELQAVFENMGEAVLVFDKQHKLVRVNRAGRSVHGLFDPDMPVEDVRSGLEVLLPNGDLLARDQWPSMRAVRGDFVHDYEVQLRRVDNGKSVFVESSTAPIPGDAGLSGLVIHTYRDVTERRMAVALRQSEARFRTLIEDAPLAIAMLRAGRFVYSNPRYRALHGYARGDDLAGLAWSTMLAPESRATLQAQQDLIAADSPLEQSFEAIGLGKAGAVVPVYKTTARVELADGPATLVFAQDISAQKLAEASIRHALDAAERANRGKAEFLANMSHEIRTPLNVVLGLAYLLEKLHLGRDAHDMVRKIRASGRSLLGIINDILDFSKIEAGRMDLEHAPFRLNDVIENVANTMGMAAGDKNIELIVQPLPAGVGAFVGDALRLEQVLVNLTGNAIKFTGVGQVVLKVELLEPRGERMLLRFSVKDTGIGIAPELQQDVFAAFSQADSSTTRRFGGTGLGLTICRQMVALMGGEIGLTSAVGKGSEFWFTVELQSYANGGFSSPDMVQINALVADDSSIAREAVAATARGLGWSIETVDSGEAAVAQVLHRLEGRLPDVVVLDWKMPGMDGLAAARAIRAAAPRDICPIVIMATAYSLSALANEAGVDLVDAVLSKPVTTSALYNAVVEARRHRAATTQAPELVGDAGSRELLGLRLLVVDDSEINCEVAKRILEEHGASVSLAFDGGAAIDWLLAHPDEVDLVLLDVQMPVLDGIEVTRRLRALPQFQTLPIVALTAGAFKSQQDAAREAGMTEFVGKPFDVPLTVALIWRLTRQWPQPALVPGPAQPQSRPPHSSGTATGARQLVLDATQGLGIWGNAATYREYLKRFVASYGDAAATLAGNIASGDSAAARALAHKLAGVAANMALPETGRLASEAERLLVEGRDTTAVVARLEIALREACASIGRFTLAADASAEDMQEAGSEPALDAQAGVQVQTLLVELLRALDADSPIPVEPVVAKLAELLPVSRLAAIRSCLRRFDFRGAEACVVELGGALGMQIGR